MKVENETTGHNRFLRFTEIPDETTEMIVEVKYRDPRRSDFANAIPLDNHVIPTIIEAVNRSNKVTVCLYHHKDGTDFSVYANLLLAYKVMAEAFASCISSGTIEKSTVRAFKKAMKAGDYREAIRIRCDATEESVEFGEREVATCA